MVVSEIKKEKITKLIIKESDLDIQELIKIKIESCRLLNKKDNI